MITILRNYLPFFLILLIFAACSSAIQLPEYLSAIKAYDEAKYQTAISLIDQAIVLENDISEFYLLRAKANYKLGNKSLCLDDLNKSIEIETTSKALHLRGKLYLEMNELEKSKRDLRQAYNINPESADLLFDLGYLEFLNGENQLALDYYINASKYDSRNPATYVNIGNLYAMMGDSKLAIDNYSKALVLDTANVIAYYNRANEKMLLGDYNAAIEDYENCLLFDSTNIGALFILAEAKTKVKDYSGALLNYNSIVKQDSSSAKAYYLRGVSQVMLDKKDLACLDFKKSGELGYFDAYEMIKKYCDNKKKIQKKVNKK